MRVFFCLCIFYVLTLEAQTPSSCTLASVQSKISTICNDIKSYTTDDLINKSFDISKHLVFENCGLSQLTVAEPDYPHRFQLIPLRPWTNQKNNYGGFNDENGLFPITDLSKKTETEKISSSEGVFNFNGIAIKRKFIGTRCELADKKPILVIGSIVENKDNTYLQTHLLQIEFSVWQSYILPNIAAKDSSIDPIKKKKELVQFFEKTISRDVKTISRAFSLNQEFLSRLLNNKLQGEVESLDLTKLGLGMAFLRIYDALQSEIVFSNSIKNLALRTEFETNKSTVDSLAAEVSKMKQTIAQLNTLKVQAKQPDKNEISLSLLYASLGLSLFNTILFIIYLLYRKNK